MTNIRIADAKGRIKASERGQVYSQTTQPDGTITLVPVKIPRPPLIDKDAPEAIYVSTQTGSQKVTVSLFSEMGWNRVIDLAQIYNLPIMIDAQGVGGVHADTLSKVAPEDVEVYFVNPAVLS